MKKCIIISDSFKGTLSSKQISKIFTTSCKDVFPDCDVIAIPIADGGEGTVDAFSFSLDGKKMKAIVHDANLNEITASYFISNDNIAIIEVASCIGLATTKNKNPLKTSSLGVGELIKDALTHHVNKIIIGLGGSSTNDVGCGIAYALNTKFYNKNNEEFLPVGESLDEIVSIDNSSTIQLLNNVEIIGMCDVSNPLYGNNGAAMIYGKQKGASDNQCVELDKKVQVLANIIGNDISLTPGAGAAGGIGAGILYFLNGSLKPGISTILDTLHFEEKLTDVDVIFTGEGRFDLQTKNGKVVEGIKAIANKYNIPVVVIAGGIDSRSEDEINHGIEAIISTTRQPAEFEKVKKYSTKYYKATITNVLKLIKLGEKIKLSK